MRLVVASSTAVSKLSEPGLHVGEGFGQRLRDQLPVVCNDASCMVAKQSFDRRGSVHPFNTFNCCSLPADLLPAR